MVIRSPQLRPLTIGTVTEQLCRLKHEMFATGSGQVQPYLQVYAIQ